MGRPTNIEGGVAPTTACQCPPRGATRLTHTQPEASCVMAVEFKYEFGQDISHKSTCMVVVGHKLGLLENLILIGCALLAMGTCWPRTLTQTGELVN